MWPTGEYADPLGREVPQLQSSGGRPNTVPDREMLHPGNQVGSHARSVADRLDVLEPRHQFTKERGSRFASQMSTEAEMLTDPEC